MKKNASMLIATLTLTAIILCVVLLAAPAQQAKADMLNNQPGLTMMTYGQVQSADELLVIMEKSSGKMLVYRLANNNFELMGSDNVGSLFDRGANTPLR